MYNTQQNLAEFDERIAAVRDSLRELVEQAAAYSRAATGSNRRVAMRRRRLVLAISESLAWLAIMLERTLFGLVAIVAVAVPALCASTAHSALQFKPGLWEFIETPKVTGDTVISEAMMAKVPAAQRAQFLAETRKMMAQSQRVRECMTQAKFDQRLFSAARSDCTQITVSNAASRIEVQTKCRGAGIQQATDRTVAASSPISVTSSMHAVIAQGGKTMTVNSIENGRWLSADCGGVRDIQVMP